MNKRLAVSLVAASLLIPGAAFAQSTTAQGAADGAAAGGQVGGPIGAMVAMSEAADGFTCLPPVSKTPMMARGSRPGTSIAAFLFRFAE